LFTVALLAQSACKDAPATAEKPKPSAEPGVDVELSPEAMKAAKLVVAPARLAPRGGALTVVGSLELSPKHVAKVGTMVEGRVTSVRAQMGDKVKAGEVLATIESSAAGRARAEHMQAEAKLQQAEKELAREKQLSGEGVSSQRALASAQTDRDVASVELRAASERLRAVGLGQRSGDAASGALALTAPMGGVVLAAKPKLGEAVQPSDDLFTVGDLSEVWLMVEVYERDLARVHEGDVARVTVLAVPGQVFEGHVDHIGEAIDPMRHAADIRVVLGNAKGALRPGMSATARLVTTGASAEAGDAGDANAVVIAKSAVQRIDGLAHLFIEKEGGKYELRAVELGAAYEGDVEVARGLAVGERVVVDGAFLLKSQVLREQMGSND
jgi:cobalt-zinc-cadmium efflux system membrane fusion protein